MAPRKVRLLIVGTGNMANSHAENFATIPGVEIVGGVDTNADRLRSFQELHGIARGFGSVAEALDWGRFDAVANVTPDAAHYRTTLPLLAAGKHVLCEKPLAVNFADADEMARKAAEAGVINMINLTYRNVAAMNQAARMVARGAIGEVRHFEASYLQSWLTQPAWGRWNKEHQWLWRLSTAHGSMGVLGDIGVHILDFATYVAGAGAQSVSCRLKTFDKAPGGRIGKYVLDANDSAVMYLELARGAVGAIHVSRFATGHLNDLRLRIFGTKGGLDVRFEKDQSILRACTGKDVSGGIWREIEAPEVQTNFQRFIAAIRSGRPTQPDFAHGAALQLVLDRALESDANGCAILNVGS